MSFDFVKIFQEMGVFALVIVGALVLMAMGSLSVFVERMFVYWRSRRESAKFAREAAALLGKKELEKFTIAASANSSHLAKLLGAGMKTYLREAKSPGEVGPVEMTRRELARKSESLSADVRRGMNTLASVGSVAPFVGLLGTVVGIIAAFEGIAKDGSGGLGAVSAGISEALVVTALGLVVAIPSVLAFNLLSAKADVILLALDQARSEFIDMLENGHAPARSEAIAGVPRGRLEGARSEGAGLASPRSEAQPSDSASRRHSEEPDNNKEARDRASA